MWSVEKGLLSFSPNPSQLREGTDFSPGAQGERSLELAPGPTPRLPELPRPHPPGSASAALGISAALLGRWQRCKPGSHPASGGLTLANVFKT